MEIKNLLSTLPQYESPEDEFKKFIQSKKTLCMGVNKHVRINSSPKLMKFVENELAKLKEDYSEYDSYINVSTTWRHEILGKAPGGTALTWRNLERDVKDYDCSVLVKYVCNILSNAVYTVIPGTFHSARQILLRKI